MQQVASGDIVFEADFWNTEGLDIYVPGNGIRFRNTIFMQQCNWTQDRSL